MVPGSILLRKKVTLFSLWPSLSIYTYLLVKISALLLFFASCCVLAAASRDRMTLHNSQHLKFLLGTTGRSSSILHVTYKPFTVLVYPPEHPGPPFEERVNAPQKWRLVALFSVALFLYVDTNYQLQHWILLRTAPHSSIFCPSWSMTTMPDHLNRTSPPHHPAPPHRSIFCPLPGSVWQTDKMDLKETFK